MPACIRLAVLLLVTPAVALADPEAPKSPEDMHAGETPARSSTRVQLRVDAKLPFTASVWGTTLAGVGGLGGLGFFSAATPVPMLLAGARIGRISAELGVGFGRSSTENPMGVGSSNTAFTLAPTLVVEALQVAKGRVALYLLGAGLLGGTFSTQRTIIDAQGGTVESTRKVFLGGFQFGIGARVALDEHFYLGLEAGPTGSFYTMPSSSDFPAGTTVGNISFYSALVGTFVGP